MKILYVLDCQLDIKGGSQKSTLTTIDGIIDNCKFEVDVLSQTPVNINDNIFKMRDKVNFIFFSKMKNKYFNTLNKMKIILRLLKTNEYDIIHVENTRFFVIIAFLLNFGLIKKNKSKFIYTDRDFYDAYTSTYQKLIKKYAYTFDKIICTTPINTKLWCNFHSNVTTISNSLELYWFNDSFVKEKHDNIYIGFCGRFVEYKRWDNVLKICELLDKTQFRFKFVFSISSDLEQNELNEYINKLKNILFDDLDYKINLELKEVQKFYEDIDIFVLTSRKESFGRTLIEAMSKKNVVFGTNSGGVPFVIKNNDFMFEINDIEGLCEKINKYHSNKDKLNFDQKYFYDMAKSNFSSDEMIRMHIDLYESIVKGEK